ncbi:hypothetical protein POTOM_039875 [Populus tomentosa]|uniref:TOD1/MUCI70 glycosyltransferase-like domain-containing protein n=1 Tax=Populus tomentosa TaxID=118781 RepID=A0A8X7YST3_POPTO|nr:hypothetical protein POTOM_039875 [Populus tomentosa]
MNGGSLGQRGSYGSLQCNGKSSNNARKPSSKMLPVSSREKERVLLGITRCLGRRRFAMLLLVSLALLVFIWGSFTVTKDLVDAITNVLCAPETTSPTVRPTSSIHVDNIAIVSHRSTIIIELVVHRAIHATSFLPLLPLLLVDNGLDHARVQYVTFLLSKLELACHAPHPHHQFVKGNRPGFQTGFDIDEVDLMKLEDSHEVIVESTIFENYDIIQQPHNISEAARKNVPFYMFIDKETEMYLKNSSALDSNMRIGLWRIIVVRNIPYTDARQNGKVCLYLFGCFARFFQISSARNFNLVPILMAEQVPKLLLHRLLPNVRYSIWIDGKLQLVMDPYQVLESSAILWYKFLWQQNASFAISRHYCRFDVFGEAEANKAARKYDNSFIDYQIEFYKKKGLSPYSKAKLPITSDVPEGCVIIREYIPITNLFSCLWFNEVDCFTARDQLSFSTMRDKMMAKVKWSINMFLDCERRNFVIQAYHKDLLDQMPPPVARVIRHPLPLRRDSSSEKSSGKNSRRGRDRRSGSRQRRKAAVGIREKQILL